MSIMHIIRSEKAYIRTPKIIDTGMPRLSTITAGNSRDGQKSRATRTEKAMPAMDTINPMVRIIKATVERDVYFFTYKPPCQ